MPSAAASIPFVPQPIVGGTDAAPGAYVSANMTVHELTDFVLVARTLAASAADPTPNFSVAYASDNKIRIFRN